MTRAPRVWALVGAVMTFSLPAAAQTGSDDADAEVSTSTKDGHPLRWRVEAGYQNEHVYGVPMTMGDLGVSLGFPTPKIGAVVYPGLHQSLGKTEYGLTVWETSARVLFDFPVGRLHLGLEPHWDLIGVRRRSKSGTMHDISLAAALVLGFDVIRTEDQSTLQVMARGGAKLLGFSSGGGDGASDTPIAHWYAVSIAYGF